MKNRPIIATLSIVFLSFAIYSGVLFFSSGEQTDTRGQAAESPTIRFDSPTEQTTVGTNIAIPIRVDSAGELTDKLSVTISYDPEYLKAVSVTPQNVLNGVNTGREHIDPVTHTVSFDLLIEPGLEPKPVAGIAGFISFKALKPGGTELRLLPSTTQSLNDVKLSTLLGSPTTINITLN
jgi:hypothetical protein